MAVGKRKSIGYIALLRENSAFRLMWSSQIVSLTGDWFNLIASALLIAQLTQSGAAVGGLFVVRFLAPFLVSPFAGVVADRYNRKHILILIDIVRGFIVLGFLFVRSPELIWLVYVLTAIQMAGQGFAFPARNALLPDITGQSEVGAANALLSATWSMMLALGAALGGIFAGTFGVYPSFVIDGITFFISAGIMAQMVYEPPEALGSQDKSVAAALRQYIDGLNYLRHHVDILVISMHKAMNAIFVTGGFQVIQVTIAEAYFPIGEGGGTSLGFIYLATGIGTGLGPIIARVFTGDRDADLRKAIAVSYFISAIGLGLTSTLLNFPVVLIGAFLRGFGGGTVWVLSTQLLMQLVPVEVRGRVFSTEFAMSTLGNAIAAGVVGTLLDISFTISMLLATLASLVLLPAILWIMWIIFGTREKLKVDEQYV